MKQKKIYKNAIEFVVCCPLLQAWSVFFSVVNIKSETSLEKTNFTLATKYQL